MAEKKNDGKGAPTPKRKEAEAKLKVNSIAPSTTKEGKKRDREQARLHRLESRAAFMRGDENALPARDKGPIRRFVRDYVDSRRTIGEYFLPVIIVVLALTLIPNKYFQLFAILFIYATMLYAILSGFWFSRKIKTEVKKRFPDATNATMKGVGMYGWMRSTQMRRMRAPMPKVERGAKI